MSILAEQAATTSKSLVERLTLDEYQITELLPNLPDPERTETICNATFSVYKAKVAHNNEWSDETLRRLTEIARGTYNLYGGDIPPFDDYDDKSEVFLVRVQYLLKLGNNDEQIPLEEWASLRFVPLSGSPPLNEDFDFYEYTEPERESQPALEFLKTRLTELKQMSDAEIYDSIFTQSRFCAIRPYATNPEHEKYLTDYRRLNGHPIKNRQSALSFALMNDQFLNTQQKPPLFITCQMHTNLSDKILSFPPFSGECKMPFTPAHQILNIHPNLLRVNREKEGVYAYQYPGYFLNIQQLVQTLKDLISTNIISYDNLTPYFPEDVEVTTALDNPKITYFYKLGQLISQQGHIKGTSITGEELRTILNEKVSDGSIWRIMRTRDWHLGVKNLINYAKQYLNSDQPKPSLPKKSPLTPPFTLQRRHAESNFARELEDNRGFPLKPIIIDAETAHREGIVTYERQGKNIIARFKHPDLNLYNLGNEALIPPKRQKPLVYATFAHLQSALSDASNSPNLPSGKSLHQAFSEELRKYLDLAESSGLKGQIEPDYGSYFFDTREERLYLIAPEFWHRLGLRVSNGMLNRDPEKKLSWYEIDQKLYNFKVGFVGLSVGGNVAEGWMRDSAWAKLWKGAEYDPTEIKNITRLTRSSLRYVNGSRADRLNQIDHFDLTNPIHKGDQFAYEGGILINPYQTPILYRNGLNSDNINQFINGNSTEPALDLLVEEADNLAIKIMARRHARENRIPVLMASDFGKLSLITFQDYKKFPDLPLGHSQDSIILESLAQVMNQGDLMSVRQFIHNLCGPEFESDEGFMDWFYGRGEQPVTSLPQLGTTALLSGLGGQIIASYALGHQIPEIIAIDHHKHQIRISQFPR